MRESLRKHDFYKGLSDNEMLRIWWHASMYEIGITLVGVCYQFVWKKNDSMCGMVVFYMNFLYAK